MRLMTYLINLSLSIFAVNCIQPIVRIKQGLISGCIRKDYFGRKYYSFKGIPYGQPPIGNLRFKAPEPAKQWNGIFNATNEGGFCPQIIFGVPLGNENCLNLNVFTPKLPGNVTNEELLPVMFFIYGGGFFLGFKDDLYYGPGFLVSQDVLLVTINYRVNAFGFLSLEDPSLDVPGNAGLKDQLLALQWVKENIHAFGGNPNMVTIFGESAGAASVHFHILSPASKGLFHRAISQSGVASCSWAFKPRLYKELAAILGLRTNNPRKILDYFRRATMLELLLAQHSLKNKTDIIGDLVFGPVIESSENNKIPFITSPPLEIMKSGNYSKVPYILGFNADEGAFWEIVKSNVDNVENLIPKDIEVPRGTAGARRIGKLIKHFYYGLSQPSYFNYEPFVKYESDSQFIYKIYNASRIHATTSDQPVYLYRFSYKSELNVLGTLPFYRIHWTKHFDEIRYLFTTVLTPARLNPHSDAAIGAYRMFRMWTTFAKTGNPNPQKPLQGVDRILLATEWLPVRSNGSNVDFLQIRPNMTMDKNPLPSRMMFWDKLYADVAAKKI